MTPDPDFPSMTNAELTKQLVATNTTIARLDRELSELRDTFKNHTHSYYDKTGSLS